ncbi:SIR2 family NAD-dependent protein deacylase [Stigmatella aurantiaca]|nr:SIR2 family protein [Stigmatella aurantiaca]ADO68469.1 conserved uncharacterized protein [Stigmatella aurantiaca DW4/3-1]
MTPSLIAEAAALAAKHKLIPFLGAGCSLPHLGSGWDDITTKLATALGIAETDPLKVAQLYVDRFGKERFCDFLKEHLRIDAYDDLKGPTHLQVMSLRVGTIYTTNQDNVMERCLEKYGRPYKVIVKLEDLAEAMPGQPLYIKYHGDLDDPASVVFTSADYAARTGSRHFLNIRLESDLLAKGLLFIGFSFRDPNIQSTFDELTRVFGGRLPPSYLLAWENSPGLTAMCAKHGIKLMVPRDVHPEATDIAEAFTQTLSDIVGETAHHKRRDELDMIFRPTVPPTRPVATAYDVAAAQRALQNDPFEEAIGKFRGLFDIALIPQALEPSVASIFLELAKKCGSAEEGDDLNAAAFNLHLSDPGLRLEVMAALLATTNLRKSESLFDIFRPSVRDVPGEWTIVALARALELLASWGRQVTDGIRGRISHLIEYDECDLKNYPEDVQGYVKHWFDKAWNDRSFAPHTTYEHPLVRYERLKAGGSLKMTHGAPGGAAIAKRLKESMPKAFVKPYE